MIAYCQQCQTKYEVEFKKNETTGKLEPSPCPSCGFQIQLTGEVSQGVKILGIVILCLFVFITYQFCSNSTTSTTTPSVQSTTETSVVTEANEKNIPGLMPVDIYLNLEEKGFETTKELNPCCSWYSVSGSSPVRYLAEVYGNSASTVYRVNASVTTTIDKNTKAIAKPFFGYIATLQYTGSNPEVARDWVEKNVGKKASTVIGGVTFELDKGSDHGLLLSLYQ